MKIDVIQRLKLLQALARSVEVDKGIARVPKHLFRDLVISHIADEFSEEWYLNTYPDVADAIKKGHFSTGLEHYATTGISEGRVPVEVTLDEPHYAATHRDVMGAIRSGSLRDLQSHFHASGFREGREFRIAAPESIKNRSRFR